MATRMAWPYACALMTRTHKAIVVGARGSRQSTWRREYGRLNENSRPWGGRGDVGNVDVRYRLSDFQSCRGIT